MKESTKYEGKCPHESVESDYGFGRSFEIKGIGVITTCVNCGAKSFSPDHGCSMPEELEWYNDSIWKNNTWIDVKSIDTGS